MFYKTPHPPIGSPWSQSPRPPKPPKPSSARRDAKTLIHTLFLVLVLPAPIYFLIALFVINERRLEKEVVSRVPVGPVTSEQFLGDIFARPTRSVIETPHGYFLMRTPGGLRKGYELVLVTKASDSRYLCNVPETICIEVMGRP